MAVTRIPRKGAEEARNQMPALLEAAEKGTSTIITRHGRPVAALVPLDHFSEKPRQKPLLAVKGTGRGLWGKSSTRTIRSLRDEWNR
jgi:prevent-host-death family protein